MEWVQVVTILASIIGLFLWTRSESNSDRSETQDILRQDRKDLLDIVSLMKDEMKDFHYRLLEIEKGRK